MTKSELVSVVKNGVAVLLIPLSLIVVLLGVVINQLGIPGAETETLVAASQTLGIVFLFSAVAYLAGVREITRFA